MAETHDGIVPARRTCRLRGIIYGKSDWSDNSGRLAHASNAMRHDPACELFLESEIHPDSSARETPY